MTSLRRRKTEELRFSLYSKEDGLLQLKIEEVHFLSRADIELRDTASSVTIRSHPHFLILSTVDHGPASQHPVKCMLF